MENPILYINACVREGSRTRELAEKLLLRLGEPFEELRLADVAFPAVNEGYLHARDERIARGELQDSMFDLARQFAAAKTIVVAAPFWDLSFPAMLKQYLEQINVVKIAFQYSAEGVPVGLCRADRLYYVTTAGGFYAPEEYGFGYVKALAQGYYGIQQIQKIQALGLDIDGADVPSIMSAAEQSVADLSLD